MGSAICPDIPVLKYCIQTAFSFVLVCYLMFGLACVYQDLDKIELESQFKFGALI